MPRFQSLSFRLGRCLASGLSSRLCNTTKCPLLRLNTFSSKSDPKREPRCWQCASVTCLNNFFCNSCNIIQPPSRNSTYFELFSQPLDYNIDLVDLEKNYKSLQKRIHPDKFSLRTKTEQTYSSEYTSTLTTAYRVLRHPVKRAQYMLSLKGVPAGDEGDTISDPEFLMEMMDKRERLEEYTSSEDLAKLRAETELDITQTAAKFKHAYENNDLEAARAFTMRLIYLDKLIEEIDKR
eukprot:TRINITY_DN1137_c0_g1_i1.p1 TRINITY_DN1137_c0_g1~~TRINITY_DN1137_c0_g1_i1.p1  ORF type:complete len:237 (+),score=4.94 TRINITY_DN1137_c0_g1_i1:79-789(+)